MRLAEEPLTKITLNLFAADVEYLRRVVGSQWTVEARNAVHAYVTNKKRQAASLSSLPLVPRNNT